MLSNVLKINDAGWLYAESHRTPMHVGMMATFSMPEDADGCYLEDLVNKWREVRTFQPPSPPLSRIRVCGSQNCAPVPGSDRASVVRCSPATIGPRYSRA